MKVSPRDAEDFVLYQIAAVAGVAAAEGVTLQHVKPHGALFNMAMRDADLASAIARATAAFSPDLMLFGLPDSELLKAGRAERLRVVAEAFADRAYEADGSLVSRNKPGAVIHAHPPPSRARFEWPKTARSPQSTAPSSNSGPTRFASTATRPAPTTWPPGCGALGDAGVNVRAIGAA
jgi:lactam utilization protein B